MVGDSLAMGLEPYLHREFESHSFVSRAMGATNLESWLGGTERPKLDEVLSVHPGIVIVSLGANDTHPASEPDFAELCDRTDTIVDTLGTVVWLNPGPLPWEYLPLRDCFAESGATIVDQPPINKPDGTHPDAEGYLLWSNVIAENVLNLKAK